MKLVTSTGDFSLYETLIPDKVRLFKDTKFKYINLEQTGKTLPELFSENDDDWKRFEEFLEMMSKRSDIFYGTNAECLL